MNNEFVEALREYKIAFNRNHSQLASELLVSVPTIERWFNLKNLPHELAQKAMVVWFKEKIANVGTGNKVS